MSKVKTNIVPAILGWDETVIMICSKCGEQSERMKSDLKTKCKAAFDKKVRVLSTSCLNICPENKIAIVVASNKKSDVYSAYSVEVDTPTEELFNKLLK